MREEDVSDEEDRRPLLPRHVSGVEQLRRDARSRAKTQEGNRLRVHHQEGGRERASAGVLRILRAPSELPQRHPIRMPVAGLYQDLSPDMRLPIRLQLQHGYPRLRHPL